MITKIEFLNMLKKYNDEEEQQCNNFLRPEKIHRTNLSDIDFDELFGPDPVNTNIKIKEQYICDGKELNYWHNHHNEIKTIVQSTLTFEEFDTIRNTIELIRGKYLMNVNYSTIDPEVQEMIQLYISLLLKRHVLGIENYFQYFDPNTAYYKRIKALTLFRFLKNPKEEIEGLCPEVSNLLYDAIKKDTNSTEQSLNVLKEYIERVFSLTRTTKQSRIEFIGEQNFDSWYQLCGIQNFYDWIREYVTEEYSTPGKTADKQKATQTSENNNKEELQSKIQELEQITQKAQNDYQELQNKLQVLQNQQEEKDQKFENSLQQLQQQFQQQLHEKDNTIQSLLKQFESLQKQYLDLVIKEKENPDENSIKIEANEHIKTSTLSKEELREKRKYYQIVMVGGSEKANKYYKKLIKDEDYQKRFFKETGLELQQLALRGNYERQKDKNFIKSLQDKLELGNITFLIAIHTDHNTPFSNLIENPEFNQRITVIGEREENDENPKYGQGISMNSLIYYTQRACEKYEREQQNSNL